MILHLSFRLFCFYFLLVLPAHRAVTDCGHTDFNSNKWPFDRASSLAHPVLCVSPLCGILRDKPGCQLWVCVPLPSVICLKKKNGLLTSISLSKELDITVFTLTSDDDSHELCLNLNRLLPNNFQVFVFIIS